MSLNSLCLARIEKVGSSQPSSSIQPLAEPIESPLRGNILEGGLRSNGMPHEGFADPIASDRTRFRSNMPVSELTERVTRAIE